MGKYWYRFVLVAAAMIAVVVFSIPNIQDHKWKLVAFGVLLLVLGGLKLWDLYGDMQKKRTPPPVVHN